MRTLLVAFLLLPLATFADEVHIAVGMSRDDAVALIKKHSGKDITPGLEVVGPKGEHPLQASIGSFKITTPSLPWPRRTGRFRR